MDTRRFTRFLEAFDRLTPSQISAAIERLGGTRSPPPHQRRRATVLPGMHQHPHLGRVHRPDRLLALVEDMLALRDVSCRASARRLGVDHITVWRWRHRVLAWMPTPGPQALVGVVEMDEAYQRESRKGSREWARHASDPTSVAAPPRLPWAKTKRKPAGHGRWSIPLLGVAPRGAQPDLVVLDRVRASDVAAAVAGHIAPDATLLTDGSRWKPTPRPQARTTPWRWRMARSPSPRPTSTP